VIFAPPPAVCCAICSFPTRARLTTPLPLTRPRLPPKAAREAELLEERRRREEAARREKERLERELEEQDQAEAKALLEQAAARKKKGAVTLKEGEKIDKASLMKARSRARAGGEGAPGRETCVCCLLYVCVCVLLIMCCVCGCVSVYMSGCVGARAHVRGA
jgi:Flp pilus assembly protein TadB